MYSLELLPIEEWIKGRDICAILNVSDRGWRAYKEGHDRRWALGEEEYYIAHSQQGYRITTDAAIIKASVQDNRKRAMNQLVQVSQTYKRLGLQDQFSLFSSENWLGAYIQASGMTRAEFIKAVNAEGLKLDKFTLSRYITDKQRPNSRYAGAFAKILKCGEFELYPIVYSDK